MITNGNQMIKLGDDIAIRSRMNEANIPKKTK